MASPMREKRAWPPDRDSDGETAAAFEAAVAVVKESVVRSGEVLSSAKEDLSDHQRWLTAQAAAVESDRERLAKWLQRQRERQEAVERRELARERRRAKRQAAIGAVRDMVAGVVFAVRDAVSRAVGAVVAVLNAIGGTVVAGVRFVGTSLRNIVLLVAGGLRRAALSCRSAVLSVLSLLGAGVARTGAKVQAVAPAAGNVASRGLGLVAATTHKASHTLGPRARASFLRLSGRAANLGRAASGKVAPVLSAAAERAHTLAPALAERMANTATAVGIHARELAYQAQALLGRPKEAAAGGENAVSSPHQIGRFDLSQMLIIAGALLLVCGTLMLGGGLLLRGAKPTVATASVSEPIAWLFEHDTLALDERSVFAFAASPDGMRIEGFAIGGVNMSDQTLDSVGSVIKPDHQARDVKLAMRVMAPDEQAGETKTFEPGVPGTIPPQGQFALLFAFPGEGGLTPEQVLSTFGGVMLKVRYEVGGNEKSFIHYLSPSFLERQLTEITGAAKGS